MLEQGDIDQIKDATEQLSLERAYAFSLAAVLRTLPIYQVYAEEHSRLTAFAPVFDSFLAAWQVLRRRPGALTRDIPSQLEAAAKEAESDLEKLHETEDFTLAEALAVESVSAAVIVLRGFAEQSRSAAFHAALGALEVDSVWAEGEADEPGSQGVVNWDGLATQYQQQVRDIDALMAATDDDELIVFRDVYRRSEREALAYVNRMRDFFAGTKS